MRAAQRAGEAIVFRRMDTGASVAVSLDTALVPGDPAQGGRLMAILQDRADNATRAAFATAWQDRVRRLLLYFADDPRVIQVTPLH